MPSTLTVDTKQPHLPQNAQMEMKTVLLYELKDRIQALLLCQRGGLLRFLLQVYQTSMRWWHCEERLVGHNCHSEESCGGKYCFSSCPYL